MKFSARDRSITETISLPDRVLLGQPFHFSQGEAVSASFGVIGAAAAVSDSAEQARLRQAAEREEVDLRRIVLEEFGRQIRSRGLFSLAERGGSDAYLEIDVPRYGLAVPSAFSSGMEPVLDVIARLKQPDGTIIWQDHESHTGDTEVSYSFDDYMSRPELLRDVWRETARVVVTEMLDRMQETSSP